MKRTSTISVPDAREFFSYDAVTGEVTVLKVPHYACKNKVGQAVGYLHRRGYSQVYFRRKTIGISYLAWVLHYGELPIDGFYIDHIDGDRLNNRISNLRLVTPRQNQQNQRRHREGGGLPGATLVSRRGRQRWQSKIKVAGGRQIWLGLYDSELQAHAAYLQALEALNLGKAVYAPGRAVAEVAIAVDPLRTLPAFNALITQAS